MLNERAEQDSTKGDWSSGMIPVLGTGGPGFNSRIAPVFLLRVASCRITPLLVLLSFLLQLNSRDTFCFDEA